MSVELICNEKRKARKEHTCSYCGHKIKPGEVYDHATLKYEGTIYDWKTHLKCQFIAEELWTYIDPNDGMTEEDFRDGCSDFCQAFVCPGCEHYDDGCEKDENYCIDKIYNKLQTHELLLEGDEHGYLCYKLKKREDHHGTTEKT